MKETGLSAMSLTKPIKRILFLFFQAVFIHALLRQCLKCLLCKCVWNRVWKRFEKICLMLITVFLNVIFSYSRIWGSCNPVLECKVQVKSKSYLYFSTSYEVYFTFMPL